MKYIWFFIWLPFFAWGQSASSSIPQLLNCTNELLGANDLLVNGSPFRRTHPRAKGFPFFKTDDLLPGTVYVGGQTFTDQKLRYNLDTDKLILHTNLKSGIPYDIELYDDLVDSFLLVDHVFISKKQLDNFPEDQGYLEQIYKGKLSFYQSQKVYFSEQFSERTPFGKFSEPQSKYFVYHKKEWNKVNSFKDFLKLFPDSAKEIKRFAKQEDIRFKKANHHQLILLLKYCNEQL